MVSRYLIRLFTSNKEFIIKETVAASGVMELLMKHRNTGERWTKDEMKQLRMHFLRLSLIVPAMIVFFLPLGSVILPILADVLDRRKTDRRGSSAEGQAQQTKTL